MSISISSAMNTFLSDRYNKLQYISYLVIYTIFAFSGAYLKELFSHGNNFSTFQAFFGLFCIGISILGMFYTSGFVLVTTHNDIKGEKSVFPPSYDFLSTIFQGLKFMVGNLLLITLLLLPIFIITFIIGIFAGIIGSGVNHSTFLTTLFSLLLLNLFLFIVFFRVYLPLVFMFQKTLKFKSLFAFSKINKFLAARKGKYLKYILKVILLSIIVFILLLIINIIKEIIGYTITLSSSSKIFFDTITYLISTVFFPLFVNLNAQFVNSATKKYNCEQE